MKIYTKTGDEGQTGLFGGPRVPKHHPRVNAYGEIDELNAALGLARASKLPPDVDELITRIQHELFAVGAELATPDPEKHDTDLIGPTHVAALEHSIDHYEDALPPLTQFILPDGSSPATHLHLARAICRRAERRISALAEDGAGKVSPNLLTFVNRLGDLLFVLARVVNHRSGQTETAWRKPSRD